MTLRTLGYTLTAVAALALAACNGSSDSDATTGSTSNNGQDSVTVGFAQVGAESAWRIANTESIQSEAEARGIDLKFSDAQGKQESQIRAIKTFIAQGVDVIAFSPSADSGWEPVLREAKEAGIPVIISDRRVDAPEDLYVTFIGADFELEGKMAADFLIEKTGGNAVIAELEGEPTSTPAMKRKEGFHKAIAGHPGMKVVLQQTGLFRRQNGKEVMEAWLKSPQGNQITAVYAHNDDMALGAIQAIQEAGKKPGVDIIVVSIDGGKDAFTAMTEGTLNATIECNPLLGPYIYDTIDKILAGESVDKWIKTETKLFDQSVAEQELPNRKY